MYLVNNIDQIHQLFNKKNFIKKRPFAYNID